MSGDPTGAIKDLKERPGKDLAIFGSSQLTTRLLEAGLVDELRIMVAPTLLARGQQVFRGLQDHVSLTLLRTTTFGSGNVLLCYRPLVDEARVERRHRAPCKTVAACAFSGPGARPPAT